MITKDQALTKLSNISEALTLQKNTIEIHNELVEVMEYLNQPTTLDSDVDEMFEQIGKYKCTAYGTTTYAREDPNFIKLRTAFSDKHQEIERYKVSVIPNYYNIMKSQKETIDKVREILKQPYKVINDYKRGFIVTLFNREMYVSGKFANQFENEQDSRSSILMEFAEQLLMEDKDE